MTMAARPRFTRAERALARKVATRLLAVERREFQSRTSDRTYVTVVLVDGKVMCDCRGWTIKKDGPRRCKHSAAVIGERPLWTDGAYLYVRDGDTLSPYSAGGQR
jgi:hypothetical protein